MVTVKHEGPVTVFRMGRHIGRAVLYYVHAFFVDGILIDSGTNRAQKEFIAAVEGMDIPILINTHHHEDHTGNNRLLQDRFGTTILAHEDALSYLRKPKDLKLRLYQRIVWDWPEPSDGSPIDRMVSTGKYSFQVIPAPGHSRDHICLHEASQGWLFTGDLFCGRRFKYLRMDEDYHTIIASLRRLDDLDCDTIFCSLLGVVKDAHSALKQKIAFMEELKAKTLNLHRQGLTNRQIRQRLLGREGLMFFVTGGHYGKQNTIDSILSGEKRER